MGRSALRVIESEPDEGASKVGEGSKRGPYSMRLSLLIWLLMGALVWGAIALATYLL